MVAQIANGEAGSSVRTKLNTLIDEHTDVLGGYAVRTGTVSGLLTLEDHSFGYWRTTGNVTIPGSIGFNCTLKAGGAHTVSYEGFGSPQTTITSPAMATGDIMSIAVDDQGNIDAVLVESADKVVFS